MRQDIRKAVDALLAGGVIAYPTESVYGLGCMPDDTDALLRVLQIKKRDPTMGLILIAARPEQFADLVALDDGLPEPGDYPITWIVPASQRVHPLVRGRHEGVAIRLTTHPKAKAICDAVDGPIVSTSANVSGRPVARHSWTLAREFRHRVDYIVPGACGSAGGASEIRDYRSGKVLRPRTS